MLPAGRVSEGDLLHLYPWREDSTVVGDLGKEELRVLACTEWPEPWTAWGMDAVDPAAEGSSVLAVPEGDAAGHVERVLGRRVHWRPTGIGLRDAVREALR